jgi:hypothetical protein
MSFPGRGAPLRGGLPLFFRFPSPVLERTHSMTQAELEREISRATGESVGTIRSLGFSLIEPPDLEPLTVDWDALEADRVGLFPAGQRRLMAA